VTESSPLTQTPKAERVIRPREHRIRPGASFRGLLQLPGTARIDGCVEGEIVVAGALWIGPHGRVTARVDAPEIIVEGELHGEVAAADRIELRATARVSADLRTPRLVLAEGSFFEGQCSTDGEEPVAPGSAFATRPSPSAERKTQAVSS
jgi:cytoskeletal protein CcmA (bactofilin family)